jgi:hypothetical protein
MSQDKTEKRYGKTRGQLNREIRQDAIREQLREQGHIQHVVECITQIQDVNTQLDVLSYQRLKTAAELRLKLVNKYLADLKSIEVSGGIDLNEYNKAIPSMKDEELREIVANSGNVTNIR